MTDQTIPPAESRDEPVAGFLAELSHELRTPLAAIIGFADAMRDRAFGPLSDIYAEHAALVHLAGRHLMDLTDDLADLAAIETGRAPIVTERFDAVPLVSRSVDLLSGQARARDIELRAILPASPLMVTAGRRQLRQILVNLISNALKATPAGGLVTATSRAEEGDLVLVVADRGVGIDAGDLAHLGEIYVQGGDADQRAAGVGLGLWLVRALCQAHGGTMEIQSVPGAGTTVSARLPVLT